MGTIFVAYGEPGHRIPVLEFAAERAAESGADLLVYHVQELADESPEAVHEEVERVMEETAPDVPYEAQVNTAEEYSDRTNVSKHKHLVDAILEADRDYEYVVMGNVERSTIEELTLSSATEAVLETRAVPVVLVPV